MEQNDDALTKAWLAIDKIKAEPVVTATARGLMFGYHHRWINDGWLCIASEKPFELPIINPDTGRQSRTFTQAGKMDKLASYEGKSFLAEHKTTSESIEDPNGTYFRRLEIDHQVSQYMLAAWQEGMKLEGTLYDVIRKPGIRPKKFTKEEIREMNSSGQYYGFTAPEGPIQLGDQETAEHYTLRLSRDTLDRPEHYFARRVLYRTDSQILEFAREMWDTSDEIRLARLHERHYKNPAACISYNTPCEYLGICSGHDTPDSDRWVKKDNVHEELTIDSDGRNVLTNSRIQCFRTCRRKHFYKFETGLRRNVRDDSEALFFGSVIHASLEAWSSCFPVSTKENRNEFCNDSPAQRAGEGAAEANVAR